MAVGIYFMRQAKALLRDLLIITRMTPANVDRLRRAIRDYKADHAHPDGGYEADRYSDLYLLFAAEDLIEQADDL